MKSKLCIGCGNKKIEGSIGVDVINLPGVDIVFDLNKAHWPFKENRFEEIYADHVLEHLNSTVNSMSEIWRVSKNGASIYINVPHFSSPNAFVDPTHVSFFTLDTLSYFTKDNDLNFYSKARFEIITKRLSFGNAISNFLFNLPKVKYFWEVHLSRVLPAKEIKFILKTIK